MSKIKIEIKNRWTGTVIFEYEKEDNTLKETVREYIKNEIAAGKSSADLRSADLRSANLHSADLRYADLHSADLRSADLHSADLRSADLRSADLHYADLHSANLRSADLRYADLHSADLHSADLRYANLHSADLRSANLHSADLRSADLRYANLHSADLRYADLRSADLRYADLHYADLRSAKNADCAIAVTRICPDGDIIGWKKCQNNKIVKLLIPADAKRNNAFGRKCRAEYAKVLEVIGGGEAKSQNDSKIIYREGEIVRPDAFDEDFTNECSGGIHFFITRIEAEKY